MPELPHLDVPFRFAPGGGPAVCNEQDSVEDVIAQARVVLLTPIGFRDEHPSFGCPDHTFEQTAFGQHDVHDDVRDALATWVPRTRALVSPGDPTDPYATIVRVALSKLAGD